MQTFSELNLKPALAQALKEMGFEKPTPIQAQALPVLMAGGTDYQGLAATGTGKTAAFGIPLLDKIDPNLKRLQAVVLCPTRELAVQTANQLSLMGKYLGIHVPAIYGGSSYREQFDSLAKSQVIVATPGRLIDHVTRGSALLETVGLVVLDEADKMISMGFKEELEQILAAVPSAHCRTWLFSATMPDYLKRVAAKYLTTPKSGDVKGNEVLSGTVRQIYFTVREKNKPKGLLKLIDMSDDFYGLIFCQTKALVMDLTQYLRSRHYQVDCLHGDKDQRDRERTLALFRERKVTILVCTDVAARGLDVQDLTHVINYSLPFEKENYIHRIGRTGRNGKEGIAYSLVSPGEMDWVPRFERLTRSTWEKSIFPSRKDLSVKKLGRFLPRFETAQGHERALAVLGEAWTTRLETMTKQEIASRFLALALPDLFEAESEVEDLGLPDTQRARDERREQRGQRNYRRPHGGEGHKPHAGRPHQTSPSPRGAGIIDVDSAEKEFQRKKAPFAPKPHGARPPFRGGKKPFGHRKPFHGAKHQHVR